MKQLAARPRGSTIAEHGSPTLADPRAAFDLTPVAIPDLERLNGGPRYRGGIDGLRDGVLGGWAIDLVCPKWPLALAFEADGIPLGTAITSILREDLASRVPQNHAGFSVPLRQWNEAARRQLIGRIEAAPEHELIQPCRLSVALGDGDSRIFVGSFGVTQGDLLAQLRDAAAREGLVVTAVASADLAHRKSGARFRGGIDWLRNRVLSGWAIDLVDPDRPLRLTLAAEDVVIGTAETSVRRHDLEPWLGDNRVGFRIDLRQFDDEGLRQVIDRLEAAPPEELAEPCDLVLRLGDGASRIELGRFAICHGDVLTAFTAGLSARAAPPSPPPTPRSTGEREAWLAASAAAERRHMTTVLRYVIGGPAAREPELGDDPRRLFALALQQAIQADRSLTKPVKSHAAAIRDLFDPLHYLATYPAVAETGENPLLHYMRTGWREGFRPNPLFDVGYYREQMGRARGEPLLHYVTKGAEAGLNPHPLFDTRFYRENALAGEDAGLNPLAHYQARGGFERRAPSPWFDTARFLDALPFGADIACPLEAFVATRELHDRDVLAGFDAPLYRYQIEVERGLTLDEPPLVHYLREGYRDPTLLPNLLFDPQFYAERNALDLKKPALLHYLAEGDRLGLACHPLFSPAHYNKQRTDDPAAMTALEYFGRHPEAGFATDRRMSRPLDPAILAFLRRLIESGDAFDCQFYRAANADLAGLDDDYVVGHYLDHGQEEGRVGTPRDLMIKSGVKLRDFPLGFFADEYIYFHPDLKYLAGNPIGCLCHFLFHGRRENRMYGRWQFHYEDLVLDIPTDAAPLRVSPAPQRMDLCVLMHVYYADIWTELPAFVQNFRNRSYDVFINLVDLSWTPELHAEIRTLCPGAFLQLSNDLGRDVGGFMRLLDNVKLDRYDVVALMHTKKSPHIMPERGEHWRRTLLRAFAGSPEVADECVDAFLADPAVGMIGAKEWRSSEMGSNRDQYERLLDAFAIEGDNRVLDYLSGTMLLIRPDVIARLHAGLRRLEWEYGGDKDVEFHRDGQVAHGVERLIPALCRQMGYRVMWR